MVMQEAIDKDEWQKLDRGQKLKRKPKVVIPEPEAPAVKNLIRLKDISIQDINGFTSDRRIVANKEGVKFIGADITINLKDKKPVSGWMTERDLLKLRQLMGLIVRR